MKLFSILLYCLIFGLIANAQSVRKITSNTIVLNKSLYDNINSYNKEEVHEIDLQLISIRNEEIKQALDYHYDIHAFKIMSQELSDGAMAYIVEYLIAYPQPAQGAPVTKKYALLIIGGQIQFPELFLPITHETVYDMVSDMPNKPQNDYSTATLTKQMLNGKWGYTIECKAPKVNDIRNAWTITYQVVDENGKWTVKELSKY